MQFGFRVMGSVTIAKSYEERENSLGGMRTFCSLQQGGNTEMKCVKAKETANAEAPLTPQMWSFITVSLGIKCVNESLRPCVNALNSIGLGWG